MSTPAPGAGKFPRTARVRRRREFQRIQADGVRVHTDAFTIVAAVRTEPGSARLGCAISRRVGNAVVRNRVRRLLREVFRVEAERLPPIDFVIIARDKAAKLSGRAAVKEEIAPALERAARLLAKRGSHDRSAPGGQGGREP